MNDEGSVGLEPRDVLVNGVRLEAYWVGPEARHAPTAVFLHQGLGSARLYGEFAARLCASVGYGGLVYSRQGYGASDPIERPLAPTFMHEQALEVLPALLSAFDVADPILIGHSDGASIAIIHAGAGHPVRALVLVAPHVFVEEVTIAGIVEGERRYQMEDFRARLERHHGANTDGTFRAWTEVWRSEEFRSWNIESYVQGVNCPALVVQGGADPFGTIAQIDAIARHAKGPVATAMIPDCGHSPHRSHAEITLNIVADFLRQTIGIGDSSSEFESRA